jgi:hypothetical protein
MDSKEKSLLIQNLRYNIEKEGKGFDYFIEKWKDLNQEDIDSLIQPLLEMCFREMQKDSMPSASYFEFQKICDYFNDRFKPEVKKFAIANSTSANEIVKLFMRLKQNGYITNTNEEIAYLISLVFNINENTALSYLKKPSEQVGVRDLLG